jgi:LmbE family N-acetylglucosaminyl deacetylase
VSAQRILAISAHPDDETLGCGGTLLKHRAAGDSLYWLVMTQPDAPDYPEQVMERAAAQVACVAKEYGFEECSKAGFPTTRLDTVPQSDIIGRVRETIAQVQPSVVYLVHEGDVHSDHLAVFSATLAVLKPFHMSKWGVRRILSYETLSSTEAAAPHAMHAFVPNSFSDITPYLERKIEIMRHYESEAQPEWFPRGVSAIRSLARFRGATIGVEYAEAFMLVRELM